MEAGIKCGGMRRKGVGESDPATSVGRFMANSSRTGRIDGYNGCRGIPIEHSAIRHSGML